MSRPIITLTTDFGVSSPYVAQMKGTILQICPDANIIDLTHAIPAQNIQAGAIVLRDTAFRFPQSTIHIGVVDPGVGSTRRIVYLEARGHRFIGPDNGLLDLAAGDTAGRRIFELSGPHLGPNETSNTFHGRDVMAPVAARIAMGIDPETFGTVVTDLVRLTIPGPQILATEIIGAVTYIDSFGNAISNITQSDLARLAARSAQWTFELGGIVVHGLSNYYAERRAGEYTALIGSNGCLELARVNGSAAAALDVAAGAPIVARMS